MNLLFEILSTCILASAISVATVYFLMKRDRKKREVEEFNKTAQDFFVRLCIKRLSKNGSEETSQRFLTFRYYGDQLSVIEIDKRTGKIVVKTMMRAFYKNLTIRIATLNGQETDMNCSYNQFEHWLIELTKEFRVHDFYTTYLWREMENESEQENVETHE